MSGTHWDHEQATIHPTVAFYIGICRSLIKEEIIHLTNDRRHNHNAVQVFLYKTLDHLRSKGVEIEEVIKWTDQASNQYKSQKGFFQMTVLNLPITRNYFGVKHGKGPSDRARAHFKNFITGVVKSKKALLVTVEELAKYSTNYDHQVDCYGDHEHYKNSKGTDKVHNLLKVTYTFNKIPREKFEHTVTYKGTQKIHSIQNTGIEGIIEKRDMLCCCPHCLFGTNNCLFPEYADIWSLISVVGEKKMKDIQLSTIHQWRNVQTKTIRSIQNSVPNVLPNDYAMSEEKSKAKTVR